jgi:hypothetical protein
VVLEGEVHDQSRAQDEHQQKIADDPAVDPEEPAPGEGVERGEAEHERDGAGDEVADAILEQLGSPAVGQREAAPVEEELRDPQVERGEPDEQQRRAGEQQQGESGAGEIQVAQGVLPTVRVPLFRGSGSKREPRLTSIETSRRTVRGGNPSESFAGGRTAPRAGRTRRKLLRWRRASRAAGPSLPEARRRFVNNR